MRSQQNRRVRNRNNNNNRRGPNPLSRNYESNGPDVKIRGNAQQIADKYISLARDAQGAGDRVMSENYLQHAEHYLRIILAAVGHNSQPAQVDENGEKSCEETGAEDAKIDDRNDEKPVMHAQSQEHNERRKGGKKDVRPSDGLETKGSGLTETVEKGKKTAEGGNETAKKSRRLSHRHAQAQESSSSEKPQTVLKLSEKRNKSAEKIASLPSSGEEEVPKKPRRRKVATTRSVGEKN
ncbi:DUF4167 domain-containing protein [Bartonella bovis]|uniref:DUF4167 domain-containing protein n=1 Tax=Bartonella bovis 91-4 TaxID=1094491 RepID=N6UIY4_9HYPH|nr:DUF4167 domain-containing protein [Bartonella bovis]ENN90213.1 hypothetical protein BBbe_11260 [Bartonella bovis 91-4]